MATGAWAAGGYRKSLEGGLGTADGTADENEERRTNREDQTLNRQDSVMDKGLAGEIFGTLLALVTALLVALCMRDVVEACTFAS